MLRNVDLMPVLPVLPVMHYALNKPLQKVMLKRRLLLPLLQLMPRLFGHGELSRFIVLVLVLLLEVAKRAIRRVERGTIRREPIGEGIE